MYLSHKKNETLKNISQKVTRSITEECKLRSDIDLYYVT